MVDLANTDSIDTQRSDREPTGEHLSPRETAHANAPVQNALSSMAREILAIFEAGESSPTTPIETAVLGICNEILAETSLATKQDPQEARLETIERILTVFGSKEVLMMTPTELNILILCGEVAKKASNT